MSKRSSISHLFMQTLEIQAPSVREPWLKALREGDYVAALRLMDKKDASANTPGKITGEHPLKTIALSDRHAANFVPQQTLATILIAKGAELRTPDKFGMYAADWAMLSGNRELARLIVKETVRQFHEYGRGDYRPNVDPFFATCVKREDRNRRFDNLVLNHNFVGRCLSDDCVQGWAKSENGYDNHLSDAQHAYWSRPFARKQADMPYYTVPLIRALKTKWQEVEMAMDGVPLSNRGSWLLDIEDAHDRVYVAELDRIRELKRERKQNALTPR